LTKAKETLRRLRREMVGLLFWALAVYLVMSLLSFSSTDPSLNHTGSEGQPIRNWGGIVGAYVSDLLLQLVGWAAFLVPLLGAWLGWRYMRLHGWGWRPVQWLGLCVAVLTVPMVVHLLVGAWTGGTPLREAGGVLGYLLCSILMEYLNLGGTWLVILLIFCVGALMITRTSLMDIGRTAKTMGLRGVAKIIRKLRPPRPPEATEEIKESKPARARRRSEVPEPSIIELPRKPVPKRKPVQESFSFARGSQSYRPPHLSMLDPPPKTESHMDRESLRMNARLLEKKLQDFGVEGKVTEVHPGPIVTLYEFEPAAGIKISRIVSLQDDLAMVLRALSVRIIAPIPGKAAVGVEIPNVDREMVFLQEILAAEAFQKAPHRLTIALGKDTAGRPMVGNLATMPHLLIAGATGSGKSVCLNAIITSILFKASPQDVKFLMVDPKRLELSVYKEIPHLLHPVVVEPKKAAVALGWAVREMERRYKWMEQAGVRNIDRYNAKMAKGPPPSPGVEGEVGGELPARLPYIVVVIDELSDLMLVASREVEECVLRLAQMARAAGIHLVVATQRPSVDVLTGTIKINLPVRIAFQVTSKFDSRTILDTQGAEHLLGAGDMLYLPPGSSGMQRIHGAYVSEVEIRRVVDHLKQQARPEYDSTILQVPATEGGEGEDAEWDEKYDDAVALVSRLRQASISSIQRHLRIGYNRAARIIERMESEGIVGPADGSKPREVLVRPSTD
jgi:DNA segregation ATPase FtsK/SpoIIIE, S-DNA-T family